MSTESIDSPEFIDSLAGLYRDCERLAESVQSIVAGVERRIEAVRRNGFIRLAELGEKLLLVQDQRPEEFEIWFEAHRQRLGFSLRTARRCKAAAREVRTLGLDAAITQALGEHHSERPEPFLSLRLSLPMSPEQLPPDQVTHWLDRLRPAVEVYRALEERAATPSDPA